MSQPNQIKVYDLPTRLFHWVLAGCFTGAFLIAKNFDDDSSTFPYHMLLGLMLTFNIVLRLIWGVIGSKYARLYRFPLHPAQLIGYFRDLLKPNSKRFAGHNPASSWAAILMILLGLGLGVTGYGMASGSNKEFFEDLHELLANAFLVTALLHIAGVILHTIKYKDYIGFSMIHGKKQGITASDGIAHSSRIAGAAFLFAVIGFGLYEYKNYDPALRKLNLFGTVLTLGESEAEESKDSKDESEYTIGTVKEGEDHDD